MELKTYTPDNWLALTAHPDTTIDIGAWGYIANPQSVFGQLRNWHILNLMLEKESIIRINGRKKIPQKRGDIFILPPQQKLDIIMPRPDYQVKRLRVRFNPMRNGKILALHSVVFSRGISNAREQLDALCYECAMNLAFRQLRIRSLLIIILTEIFRQKQYQGAAQMLSPEQAGILTRYMHDNLHRTVEHHELSDLVNLSPQYFSRIFKKTFSISPRTWMVRERIKAAAYDIQHSSLPITRIARRYGYTDMQFFSRQFKSIAGVSPREYRKQHPDFSAIDQKLKY